MGAGDQEAHDQTDDDASDSREKHVAAGYSQREIAQSDGDECDFEGDETRGIVDEAFAFENCDDAAVDREVAADCGCGGCI